MSRPRGTASRTPQDLLARLPRALRPSTLFGIEMQRRSMALRRRGGTVYTTRIPMRPDGLMNTGDHTSAAGWLDAVAR